MSSFKHLVRILTDLDNDWPAVVGNLRKLQKKWAQMSRIMGIEGANMPVLGTIFKVVVQAVLLFGSRAWVIKPSIG